LAAGFGFSALAGLAAVVRASLIFSRTRRALSQVSEQRRQPVLDRRLRLVFVLSLPFSFGLACFWRDRNYDWGCGGGFGGATAAGRGRRRRGGGARA